MQLSAPLSVAVLIDLERRAHSGGHLKCWEQFAEAAVDVPGVDVTIYVLGRRHCVDPVSANVRYVVLRPVVSSSLVTGLVGGVDATDLYPYHPTLGHCAALPVGRFGDARTAMTADSTGQLSGVEREAASAESCDVPWCAPG